MKSGILLIDKEEGFTSTDVDRKVGRFFGTKKVGHLGTLDPFATGLLIIAVEKGTKYLQFIPDGNKSYLASLQLGIPSSTGDKTGELGEKQDIPSLTDEQIAKVLSTFKGKQTQIPPMTSSIKVNGKALYKLAHKGIEIERKPRDIEVFNINFFKYENGVLDFSCTVSKGTYIRTLGEDIAKALGTVGHLLSLRRLSIDRWLVHYAKKIDEITEDDLLSPDLFLTSMKHVNLKEDLLKKVKNGVAIEYDKTLGEEIMFMEDNKPLAVYRLDRNDNLYHCVRGLE